MVLFHCFAHCNELVFKDATSLSPLVETSQDLHEDLYALVSVSPKRVLLFQKIQEEVDNDSSTLRLKNLSRTGQPEDLRQMLLLKGTMSSRKYWANWKKTLPLHQHADQRREDCWKRYSHFRKCSTFQPCRKWHSCLKITPSHSRAPLLTQNKLSPALISYIFVCKSSVQMRSFNAFSQKYQAWLSWSKKSRGSKGCKEETSNSAWYIRLCRTFPGSNWIHRYWWKECSPSKFLWSNWCHQPSNQRPVWSGRSQKTYEDKQMLDWCS